MKLNITARHLDLTPALSEYVQRKVGKAERYFDSIVWAQVILSVEKHRHIAEIVVHTPGSTFRVKEEAGDLYSAVDLAAHKLDLHLSRVKERRKNHRLRTSSREVLLSDSGNGSAESVADLVGNVRRVTPEPKSLSQAIENLNTNSLPFLLFLNRSTHEVNVVYKKGRDRYGLLEVGE